MLRIPCYLCPMRVGQVWTVLDSAGKDFGYRARVLKIVNGIVVWKDTSLGDPFPQSIEEFTRNLRLEGLRRVT